MSYSVGSIADLISGQETPNKPKVIERKVKIPTPAKMNNPLHPREKQRKVKTGTINIDHLTNGQSSKINMKNKYIMSQTADSEQPNRIKKSRLNPTLTNAEKRIKGKISMQNKMAKQTHDMCKDRTIFVGNVAIGTTRSALRKLFKVYGPIESIRFRSIPVSDAKIPKKLAAIKQQFHENRTSTHSYIKFVSAEDSQKALVENGKIYDDHHIRVSHCNADETVTRDESKAVFVGNIGFDCEEEELWTAFADCGSIESVRIIRDRFNSIGKGFGYVNFTSADAVQMALEMDNTVSVRNRQLRIAICRNNPKKDNKKKKLVLKRKQPTQSSETIETPAKKKSKSDDSYQGVKFTDIKKKKKVNKGANRKKKIAKLFTPKGTE